MYQLVREIVKPRGQFSISFPEIITGWRDSNQLRIVDINAGDSMKIDRCTSTQHERNSPHEEPIHH